MPAWVPIRSRMTFGHEMVSTFFFTLALAMIEGGVVAVFARQTFETSTTAGRLNLAVAGLGAMSELANILSFVWTPLSSGKRVVPFVNGLQVGAITLVGLISLLPTSSWGLWMLVGLVLAARLCWSGIITIRTSVWRANYPAKVRARIVGMVSTVQVIVIACGGAGLGYLLDRNPDIFRLVIPLACGMALLAVWSYGKIKIRRESRVLKATASHAIMMPWQGPLVVWRVLKQDLRYAQFMGAMFVLGFGNLMINPILVISLKEEFGFRYFASILITSTIQAVVQVLFIPMWAKLLDSWHVVKFRSIHSWLFVASSAVFTLGAILHRVELMFLGAAILGIGYAGGALAWNLGHVDFSPPSQTSYYMATHVTLNGVRGLIAPLVSVTAYELFKAANFNATVWMLSIALVVNALGAYGFVALRRAMERERELVANRG